MTSRVGGEGPRKERWELSSGGGARLHISWAAPAQVWSQEEPRALKGQWFGSKEGWPVWWSRGVEETRKAPMEEGWKSQAEDLGMSFPGWD